MGRVLRGRLVVTAGGAQHVYDVTGRLPAYTPPPPPARSSIDTGLRRARGSGLQPPPAQ